MAAPEDRPEFRELAAKLGPELKRRRREAGLSQLQMAKASGLSRNQIQNIEMNRNNSAGAANPTLSTLVAVSSALGVRLDRLLAGLH